jgi:outer membrane protein assembly factor BamD
MKRTTLFCLAAGLLMLAGVVSCRSEYDQILESNDIDAKYNAAFNYFNAGKYTRSTALFESLTMLTNGTDRHDTVLYYLGLSNYSYQDYYTAETNFDTYLSYYPQGAFAEQADFLRIDCLYRSTLRYELDQTPTYTAITAMGEYLQEHPVGANADILRHRMEELGERLDRKAFENARLYYKMEDYKASRVAFKNILKDDADNVFREEILYYSAMSSYKFADNSVPAKRKERFLVFQDDYLNFIGEYPESEHRKELDGLYEKVKEKY